MSPHRRTVIVAMLTFSGFLVPVGPASAQTQQIGTASYTGFAGSDQTWYTWNGTLGGVNSVPGAGIPMGARSVLLESRQQSTRVNHCVDAVFDWHRTTAPHYDPRVVRQCYKSNTPRTHSWSDSQNAGAAWGIDGARMYGTCDLYPPLGLGGITGQNVITSPPGSIYKARTNQPIAPYGQTCKGLSVSVGTQTSATQLMLVDPVYGSPCTSMRLFTPSYPTLQWWDGGSPISCTN
jgi:hypothetical protein